MDSFLAKVDLVEVFNAQFAKYPSQIEIEGLFKKVNGEMRYFRGLLNKIEHDEIKDDQLGGLEKVVIRYFDIESDGYRSFKLYRLKELKLDGVQYVLTGN